jgi:hypothetical protein
MGAAPFATRFARSAAKNQERRGLTQMRFIIEPLGRTTRDDVSERRCVVVLDAREAGHQRTELWFQFGKEIVLPKDDDCDAYLLAVIMSAMKYKADVHVKGSVSEQLLSNLVEYQAAWAKWLPGSFTQVEITCDDVRVDERKLPGAVCAFSGGVDASFSVWRHSQSKWSHRSKDVALCAIVHGFDIPLADEVAFENAAERAQRTLGDLDIPLQRVKTNFRTVFDRVPWGHAFSCALAAVLNNLKAHVGTCLIGSSEPYDSLVIPWGSSPITDHLLGSGDFDVIHDGASHSRTEKVRELLDWKVGVENLRVCWQGEFKDRNCGRCEKCVRTKLNFLAVGHGIPSCFPQSDMLDDMRHITLNSDAVRAEWQQIYRYAQDHNIDSPWLRQMRAVINKRPLVDRLAPIIDTLAPERSARREAIKWVIQKARLS